MRNHGRSTKQHQGRPMLKIAERNTSKPEKSGSTAPLMRASAFAETGAMHELFWHPEATMILPAQFFRAGNESFAVWTGERRLLLAILEEAVHSFLKYRCARSRRGRRLFDETVDWFWSQEQSWLYSFENICRHLDLDPNYIRGGLRRLEEEAGRSLRPLPAKWRRSTLGASARRWPQAA